MTLNEFKNSLNNSTPPEELSNLLEALWFDAQGDWNAAHKLAQVETNSDGAWIHAYLHRKEGDIGNAGYWYREAGKNIPEYTLNDEWENIVNALLKKIEQYTL